MPMSKEEMLARIQAGAEDPNTPELDPEVADKIRREFALRSGKGWNLPVGPQKPDIERDIDQNVNNATSPPGLPRLGKNPAALQQPQLTPEQQAIIDEHLGQVLGTNKPQAPIGPSMQDVQKQMLNEQLLKRYMQDSAPPKPAMPSRQELSAQQALRNSLAPVQSENIKDQQGQGLQQYLQQMSQTGGKAPKDDDVESEDIK